MTATVTERVGPRMWDAYLFVRDNPGCNIAAVARVVGPHGSYRYGYATTHRAIAAGLLRATRHPSGVYALYVA